jgi:hypothetical protein
MIVKEHIDKKKNMEIEELMAMGCSVKTGRVYRHSETLKNDISFLMATEETTTEELMKIFFDGEQSQALIQLPLKLSNRE